MKKFIKFIIIIITFILSIILFSQISTIIGKGSKSNMAKLI